MTFPGSEETGLGNRELTNRTARKAQELCGGRSVIIRELLSDFWYDVIKHVVRFVRGSSNKTELLTRLYARESSGDLVLVLSLEVRVRPEILYF